MSNVVEQLSVKLVGDLSGLGASVGQAEQMLSGLADNAEKAGARFVSGFGSMIGVGTAVGATLTAIAVGAAKLGAGADATFRTIGNNLPTFNAGLDALRDNIADLAISSGRSLGEMQSAALEISKLGVSSTADLQQQLTAATALSDATGASLDTSVQLLEQMRREFGLVGDQALATAAKLAEATKGHASIDDMLAAFQRATPIFQQFGISADTGIRAIVALIQKGATARSVGKDLGEIADAAGFEKLASEAQIASGYMDDFNREIENTRAGTARAAESVKAQFSKALEDLGEQLRSVILPLLQGVSTAMKNIGDMGAATRNMSAGMGLFGGSGDFRGHGAAGTFGGSAIPSAALDGGTTPNPLAGITTKEDLKKQQEAVVAGVEKIKAVLESLKKETESSDQAMKALGDALANLSGDALAHFDQSVKDTTDSIKKQIEAGDPARTKELTDRLTQLNAAYAAIRPSVAAVSDAQTASLQIQHDVADGNLDIEGGLSDLSGMLDVYKQKAAESLNPTEAENYKKAVDLITAAMDNLGLHIPKALPKEDDLKLLKEIAKGWDTIGRSIVAAAQALGGLDDKSAAALQNVVSLGDGIAKVISGDVTGGLAEGLTSLAGLVSSLFHRTPSAEERQQAANVQANTKALDDLRLAVESGQASSVTGGLRGEIGALALKGSAAALAIRAGTTGPGTEPLTDQELLAMQQAAKALGITLDGSSKSIEALEAAINLVMPNIVRTEKEAADAQAANLKIDVDSAGAITLAQKQAVAREQLAEQQREEMQAAQDKLDDDAAQGLDTTADQAAIALLTTKHALQDTALAAQQFADSISAINDAIAQKDAVFGTDATTSVGEYASAYKIDLSPYDLTTKAGDDAAISYLQGLFSSIDDSDPNAVTKRAEIQLLVAKIRALPPDTAAANAASTVGVPAGSGAGTAVASDGSSPAEVAVSEVKNITTTQGDILIDTDRAQLAVQRGIRDLLGSIARTIITPPQIPFGFGALGAFAGAAGAGGTVTIAVNVQQTFNGPVGQVDRAAALALGNLLIEEINAALASDFLNAQRIQGVVIQT